MSRQKRIYFQNAVYHICIRGNNKQSVLVNDTDKRSLLDSVEKFRSRFGFKLHAFVLMNNHAHLVIGTNGKINISKIMQAITLSYSVKFRKKYLYTGYVWQGRFKSNVIEDEKYILECINYIHNNPARAGMVDSAKDYLWSSYHSYNDGEHPLKEYIKIDLFTV